MNSNWNKNIYRALLLLSFIAVNALVIFAISEVYGYLNSGADRSKLLHLSTAVEAAYQPKMLWDTQNCAGRPMEAQTLKNISRDYKNAWYFYLRAFHHNDAAGLKDYFTDRMLSRLEDYIALNRKNSVYIEKTTLEHQPELKFYSADGKIVTFTDHNVRSYEKAYQYGSVIDQRESQRSYQVVLLLEDGFWRIRQLVEIESDSGSQSRLSTKTDLSGIDNIRGINYYPREQPWSLFNEYFSKEVIEKDFKLIQEMGFNTLRIFIPYEDFGGAEVIPEKLARLKEFMDLARKRNLKVLITLFDFYGNYELNDWTLTQRHAEQLVSALKDHPALLGWDIKNEPDLDFDSRGKEVVLSWLTEMRKQLRIWDKTHPITIGWSSPEAAAELTESLDFISFHYYRDVQDFPTALAALRAKAKNKPLLLQEFGRSSYSGFWNFYSGSEKKQASYYREMMEVVRSQDVPFMVWTLYDFEKVPQTVVGRLPWRKQPQRYYGLIDSDGKAKPALEYVAKVLE
ncbi:cellulase family glycosylhydrolase [Poritiphilus flavus]|uniref:Cellulase family glycosylhydrolase n=1 Tax=Poritiphilus flavus TaxID=2697053 RepID=A0A6L9E724_9FLAO|nr:cellulase family glycosylhydrolase [Poritiphilus flavus]NAS10434.1 cellulase family glycosylhydrolase [Poritiphilus flavus]